MKSLNQEHAIHKRWMLKLLVEIADEGEVSQNIGFKGGSCASLLGYLDRFSVDLDFDLLSTDSKNKKSLRKKLYKIFENLELDIIQESKTQLQFFLRYKSTPNERSTLKLEIIDNIVKSNIYQDVYIPDIDRYLKVQTIETMFANKLVAPIDRYERHNTIATRDIYDINVFFHQGFSYSEPVIVERRNTTVMKYLEELLNFVDSKITNKSITQDLNYLLTPEQFKIARKNLKAEVIENIRNAINQLD